MGGYLITGVRIFDGTGRAPLAGEVRVPGPRPLANGPEPTVTGGLGDTDLLHPPHRGSSSMQDGDAIRMIMKDGALHKAP
ncbi:MAG TPA: hypothetical protein VFX28_14320 [Methylomirabilota bacterium]|nr:hypothetical protein [Methylomirabilota bacterium]